MAEVAPRAGAPAGDDETVAAQHQDASSYKAKLLQPSDKDELSHPQQEEERPKLPPVEDEGSPPMTVPMPIQTKAPEAGSQADTSSSPHGHPWSPTGSTQTAIDGRHKFAHFGSGRQRSVKEDWVMPQGGAPAAAQPQNVDDYSDDDGVDPARLTQPTEGAVATQATDPEAAESAQINISEAADNKIGGTILSDVEQQVISDPSTADLLAAATATDAAVIRTEDAPAGVMVMPPDETLDGKGMQTAVISAVLPGSGAGTPIVTAADAAAGTVKDSSDDAGEADSATVGSQGACADSAAEETAAAVPEGETQAAAGGSGGDTQPEEAGAAASYGHLQQAPAAAGDAAAVPAPATPDTSGRSAEGQEAAEEKEDESAGVKPTEAELAAAEPAAQPAVPEPAVGVAKEGDVVGDAAAEGDVESDVLGDNSGSKDQEEEGSGGGGNILKAAAEVVAAPAKAAGGAVAAAMGGLKDVLIGHDVALGGDDDRVDDKAEEGGEGKPFGGVEGLLIKDDEGNEVPSFAVM